MVELFRRYYGPTMNAFDAATRNGTEQDLHRQLLELAHAQNRADAGSGVAIPATFMRVSVAL